jgi:hypothetical protein
MATAAYPAKVRAVSMASWSNMAGWVAYIQRSEDGFLERQR